MSVKLHQTKDGSSTLYSSEFDQYYHNPNGAATESLYVFFEQPGLIEFLPNADSITILEVGFGTGLNFLLLLDLIKKSNLNIPVNFYSIEAFPIKPEMATKIDFTDHLSTLNLMIYFPVFFRTFPRHECH